MALLPAINNSNTEKNQESILNKMDDMFVVVNKLLMSQNTLLANSNKLLPYTIQSADNLFNLAAQIPSDKIFPFIVQIADNVYNIAGALGAQVTSFKEVEKALLGQSASYSSQATSLKDIADSLGNQTDPMAEQKALEQSRETPRDKKPGVDEKEKKQLTFFEKLSKIFETVLFPLIVGFVVGLGKSLGLFNSGLGRLVVIFGILYAALGSFRKVVNSLVISMVKAVASRVLGKPSIATPVETPQGKPLGKPDISGKPGAGGKPEIKGKPDSSGKMGKPGPSGLDNFLSGAQKIGKSIKDLFVGIADTISQVLGKLADGIKTFLSKVSEGLSKVLTNIAKGIKSFGDAKVLQGAAALLVVSGALYVAAKAFKEFADVKWDAMMKGFVAIIGLVGVVKLLEKVTGSIIKGSLALGIMAAALYVAGKAFQQFADVKWETLAIAAVGIGGLAVALGVLGTLIVPITLGAAALGIMSVALGAFGLAVLVMSKGLPVVKDFLVTVSQLDGTSLTQAAAGITAVGVALAALGGGQVIQAIGNFVSKMLSFGDDDIFTKLTNLGDVAGDINKLPDTIKALGELSNFKVSNSFMDNIDILAKGLKKLADSSKGFEKTGDSLKSIASIAQSVQSMGAATSQDAGASPVVSKLGSFFKNKKGDRGTDDLQARVDEGLNAKLPNTNQLVAGELNSGTYTNDGRDYKITPELKAMTARMINPVNQPNAGGGGTSVVSAPQSTVVNAPSNQTINSSLSGYGVFGGLASLDRRQNMISQF